jgi:hypothetical protein
VDRGKVRLALAAAIDTSTCKVLTVEHAHVMIGSEAWASASVNTGLRDNWGESRLGEMGGQRL